MPVDSATPIFDPTKLMLWDDNPATADLLGIEGLAQSIEKALEVENLDPLTIGIHSPWGGGKTTTLGLLETRLKQNQQYVIIRTNPWEYDNHDDVRALLIAEIVDALQQAFKDNADIGTKATDLIKRISWSRVSALVAKGAITMQWNPEEIVKAFTPKSRETPESMSGFRDAFTEFLGMLPNTKRVIVLVDDLDRCLPDAVMATLESIKLFLSVNKMAFVLAADQEMVRDAIAASLHASGRSEVFASRYLEKIVQLPVLLPRLSADDAANYIALLFSGAAAPTPEGFQTLVDHCQARRTAGQSPLLGNLTILSWRPDDALLQLAERIATGLSAEKVSNPRYVKRFLNSFGIRMQVARANGLEMDPQVIAKLYLLEDRYPKDFELLVGTPEQDRAALIESWEAWASGSEQAKPEKVNDDTRAWAAAVPSLAGIELGRYLALAASFMNMSIGANLSDDQIRIANNLVSSTQAFRQSGVEDFKSKASTEQALILNAVFGSVRRLEQIDDLITSLVEIAKEVPAQTDVIVGGIREHCWQKIEPAAAVAIMVSEVAPLVELGTQLEADANIAADVKVAIRQAR